MIIQRTPPRGDADERPPMSEFAPPTGRLAVTRKGNELRALPDSSVREENSIQIIYHEYKEKFEALGKAYE